MARYLLLLFVLCIAPAAMAAGLIAQSPADGATVTTAAFSFSTESRDAVESCSLLIDGEEISAVPYGQPIAGKSITYRPALAEGSYAWQVSCTTATGELTTEERTVAIQRTEEAVKVTSGPVRGTSIREFTISNSAEQQPVEIAEVAPGDYLSIILEPQNARKELYVRSKLAKDGRSYLWLTHQQQDYYIWEGENTTIDVGPTTILLELQGIVTNRAVIIAYPNVTGLPPAQEEQIEEPPQEPVDEPAAAPEEPPEEPPVTPEEPAQDPERPVQEPDRPGLFTRLISWLTSIFGI